jgi:N-formylglutamate amidohydrolase
LCRRLPYTNRSRNTRCRSSRATATHDRYHASLADFCRGITRRFGAGVLLDIHGQGEKADVVFRGTDDGGTVRHASRVFGSDAVVGPRSILGLCRAGGWHVHPDPLDGREALGFTGGYIVRTYGTLPGTDIDAYQLAFGREFRRPERRQTTAATLAAALADYARRYLPGAGVEAER